MQLFGSLKLLMSLLGSSCPLLGRSGPKMGPKMVPKNAQKRNQRLTYFCFVFKKMANIRVNLSQFWNPNWTSSFAQNSKKIYKRSQDEPKRAIMSFKESKNCLKKTLKNNIVFNVFGSRDLPRDPQETQEPPKKHPKSSKGPKKNDKNKSQ